MKHVPFAAVLVLSLTSVLCSCENEEKGDLVTMRVNHYQQPVNNHEAFIGLAYLVQQGEAVGSDTWSRLADDISGFDYALGYMYTIEVRKLVLKNPVMDASAVEYTFVRLLSKEPVPAETAFDITLSIRFANGFEPLVTMAQDSTFSLLGGTVLDCGDLRSELTAGIDQQLGLIGTFVHGEGDTLLLRGLRVQD